MREEIIYYLYSFYLKGEELQTVGGENLQVLDPGQRNPDSGPDYFNARIKIADTLWAGNVEIHVKSSDWFQHKHHENEAFDNVILHVVFDCNARIFRKSGEIIPCVEIKDLMQKFDHDRLKELMEGRRWIPCENLVAEIDTVFINSWLNSLMIERLIRRTEAIMKQFNIPGVSWEEVMMKNLFMGFGLRSNKDQFLLLANTIGIEIMKNEMHDKDKLEALMFGTAGLLPPHPVDDYTGKLLRLFEYQQQNYKLSVMPGHIWKFKGNRPSGFPTIRISQLAGYITANKGINLLSGYPTALNDLMKSYRCKASAYWSDHYLFQKEAALHGTGTGDGFIISLLVNVNIPLFFAYGRLNGEEKYTALALNLLDELPPEQNVYMQRWKKAGIKIPSAFYSQALMELKEFYCDRIRCLNCRIGFSLLKRSL